MSETCCLTLYFAEKHPGLYLFLQAALMKDYGKESRHNVISRKDNLILVPDKPEQVPSGSEPKEWAVKALAGKEVNNL